MKTNIKLVSWNVNGIRAIWKKGAMQEFVTKNNPDILVLQETKSTPDQLTEEMKSFNGYTSYFESSSMRKGYSGVAIYTKEKPIKVTGTILKALGEKESEQFMDNEGRTLIAEYENFYLMNCYWPNGGKSEDHYNYKLSYYEKTLKLMQKLEKKKPVIFTGDINATVADMDLARPKENAGKLGCTEPERERLRRFVDNFVDTYRLINHDKVQYTWWDMKTRSREKNVGWRIDYFFVSKSLHKDVVDAKIMDEVMGSDHCPILLEVKV
jgi:exodeoxyribonuclease-3